MTSDHAWSDLPPLSSEATSNGADPSQPNGAADDDAEIARLAKLSPIDCDRALPGVAEKLGCRVSTLRAAVGAARGNGAAIIPGQGRPLDLPDPDHGLILWTAPICSTACRAAIRQYVILDQRQAEAIALWAVFTHAFDAFDFSPRLVIRSPEKRSGRRGSSK